MLNISGSAAVLAVVVAIGASVLGFVLSEADRRKLGRTPWGLPSLVWALFWFLSWIVGLVLFLIAHRAEVRRAAQGPTPALDAYGHPMAAPPPRSSAGSDFPAYPRPAGGDRRSPPVPPAPPSASPPPPAPPPAAAATPAAASAPPSWQPDPGGRYHYRWWSGTEWTSYVSTHGHVVVDTSPDQRIGPY